MFFWIKMGKGCYYHNAHRKEIYVSKYECKLDILGETEFYRSPQFHLCFALIQWVHYLFLPSFIYFYRNSSPIFQHVGVQFDRSIWGHPVHVSLFPLPRHTYFDNRIYWVIKIVSLRHKGVSMARISSSSSFSSSWIAMRMKLGKR